MLNNSRPDVQNKLSSKVSCNQAEESHQSNCFTTSDHILSLLAYCQMMLLEMMKCFLLSEEPMPLLVEGQK